jgi:hypothetical protein
MSWALVIRGRGKLRPRTQSGLMSVMRGEPLRKGDHLTNTYSLGILNYNIPLTKFIVLTFSENNRQYILKFKNAKYSEGIITKESRYSIINFYPAFFCMTNLFLFLSSCSSPFCFNIFFT